MRNRLAVSLFLVAGSAIASACGGAAGDAAEPTAPASAAPSCEQMGQQVADEFIAGMEKAAAEDPDAVTLPPPEEREQHRADLASRIAEACVADAWPAEAIQCVLDAKEASDMDACGAVIGPERQESMRRRVFAVDDSESAPTGTDEGAIE